MTTWMSAFPREKWLMLVEASGGMDPGAGMLATDTGVVFLHPDDDIVSGRISEADVDEVCRGANGAVTVRYARLRALIAERSHLSSLQVLTYAQLTGPHVAA